MITRAHNDHLFSFVFVSFIHIYLTKNQNVIYLFLSKVVKVESTEKIVAYHVDTVLFPNSAITSTEHV